MEVECHFCPRTLYSWHPDSKAPKDKQRRSSPRKPNDEPRWSSQKNKKEEPEPKKRKQKRRLSNSDDESEQTKPKSKEDSEESSHKQKDRKRIRVSRSKKNTHKSGYRLGVVTWNTHGLQKPHTLTTKDALDVDKHLKFVSNWIQNGYELESVADALWNWKGPRGPAQKKLRDYFAVFEDFEQELKEQRHFPYLKELITRYEQLTGKKQNLKLDKPEHQSVDRRKGVPALLKQCENLAASMREDYDSFDEELHECIRTLLRAVSCQAILSLFEKHKWLDVLVLQEVKYTGIKMLEETIGSELFVHPGPMLSSGRGKKREIEYFPIIMRKDGSSIHHPYKLSLKKVWWINTDGGSQEMGLGDKRYPPNGAPHMTWNKSQNTFRPIVVFDVKIGEEDASPLVHIGVVHTTPGPRTVELTPAEKRSIRALTGSTRKKDISSHEFQRPHQYFQIEQAFDKVSDWAYDRDKDHEEYFGPWILAGDYYLFKESRVTDMDTAFTEEEDFGDFSKDIREELKARLTAYSETAKLAQVCAGRFSEWTEQFTAWSKLKVFRKTTINR